MRQLVGGSEWERYKPILFQTPFDRAIEARGGDNPFFRFAIYDIGQAPGERVLSRLRAELSQALFDHGRAWRKN